MKIAALLAVLACAFTSLSLAAAEIIPPTPMLAAHNAVRSDVGVPPLAWSNTLAKAAADWADHLSERQHCTMKHADTADGENLYWASPLKWSDGRSEVQKVTAQQVVQSWASERAGYDYATNTCRAEPCGHYTQVVWRTTREVGCAMRVCSDKAQLWVCRYAPAGNWVGERPY